MNAEYSGCCEVNRKCGMNNVDIYFDSTMVFWLEGEDAREEDMKKKTSKH